ncbi:hypothetical protein MMC10_005221 [Thelotrema lepadinum]|nr:hypothetical protein [Thelotrema lepadinum]
MTVSSLQDLCKRQAVRMINHIDDLGSLPFRLAKPLLFKVQTAAQLHRIEQNSPHFIGETGELWLDLIKRDVPNWQSKHHEPRNPESWHKVYKKLVRESDQEIAEDALILQASLKGLEAKRNERTSKVVDSRTVPKLPRVHGMRVDPAVFKRKAPEKLSDLRFTSGSKTKMVTGKDVILRARREARERSNFTGQHAVLARPTHMLQNKATRVRDAPLGLVEAHQRSSGSPATDSRSGTPIRVIAPRKPSNLAKSTDPNDPNVPHKYTREEREARLKAIATGKPIPKPPTSTSASTNPQTLPLSSSSSPKRKRDNDSPPMDDIFGETDTARKNNPPVKRQKSSSPPIPKPSAAPNSRPRAMVRKAPVDIFMRRGPRAR